GARGSTTQAASRSARRRRCSTSRKARTPPSDESKPPSNLTTTGFPPAGDRPGNGRIGSFMGGGLTEIARIGFDNQILRDIRYLSYIRQPAAHNPGQLSSRARSSGDSQMHDSLSIPHDSHDREPLGILPLVTEHQQFVGLDLFVPRKMLI